MESRISVIIPMYNSRETIVACVESVVVQIYSGCIDIIVIDDGSSDDGLSVLKNAFISLPENRILTILNKENGGVSSARNMGVKAAKSEWIAFLDSDDIWYQDKLAKQLDIIHKNPCISFIGSNRNSEEYPFFGKSKNAIYSLSAKNIIVKWYPQTSTVLLRRDLIFKVGLYNEDRTHGEDCDLWLRIAKYKSLWVINQDLVFTGGGKRSFGSSGLSANLEKMYEGEVLNLNGALSGGLINIFEFFIFRLYFILRYFRRNFIVWIDR